MVRTLAGLGGAGGSLLGAEEGETRYFCAREDSDRNLVVELAVLADRHWGVESWVSGPRDEGREGAPDSRVMLPWTASMEETVPSTVVIWSWRLHTTGSPTNDEAIVAGEESESKQVYARFASSVPFGLLESSRWD